MVSPQITISKSTQSRRRKLMFSRFAQKQLQIHEETKNRLNMLSHRLLVGGHLRHQRNTRFFYEKRFF